MLVVTGWIGVLFVTWFKHFFRIRFNCSMSFFSMSGGTSDAEVKKCNVKVSLICELLNEDASD